MKELHARNGKIVSLRSLREGRSPAESRPDACRLVRPGAACESGTGFSAVTGEECASVCRARMRVVPRKVEPFVPVMGDERLLLCPGGGACACPPEPADTGGGAAWPTVPKIFCGSWRFMPSPFFAMSRCCCGSPALRSPASC